MRSTNYVFTTLPYEPRSIHKDFKTANAQNRPSVEKAVKCCNQSHRRCSPLYEAQLVHDAISKNMMLYSVIHSGHFYSAASSLLLLKSAPDTARILCRSFTEKRQRQLRVKNLPKVPTWWLERDSNPRPSGQKASTLPMRLHVSL